jgi:hypothetical protein
MVGFVIVIVWGLLVESIPSWDDILDAVCLLVPPKTVASAGSPLSPHSNTIHNPTHQDAPTRQPIIMQDEFRVLMLEPGWGTDEIRCRLVNVARSWRTRYDALSYTWGDETVTDCITVDGLRTNVTKNLYSALVHLRHGSRPRMLWVDALCIDQDNIEERDEQIAKMGSIYSSARRVIIWLGERTEEVEGALQLVRKTRYTIDRDRTLVDWSPVLNLLRRPWFQRTWIIQEAVLAREPLVACGFGTIPFSMLSSRCGYEAFQEIVPDDPLIMSALNAMDMIEHGRHEHHTKFIYRRPARRRGRQKYNPDFRLVSTLYETRGFECRDKRDKVFGVLSMVLNVEPDDEVRKLGYGHSLEEVYETVAQWDISKNESLEVLSYCSRKAQRHPDLPSWVPDFSDMDDALPVSVARKLKHPTGSNAGFKDNNKPSFTRENGKMVLTVSGKVVDTISRVGTVAEHSKMVVYSHPQKRDNNRTAGPNTIAKPDLSAVAKRREWFKECVRVALASDPVARRNSPERAVDPFLESPTFGMSVYQFDNFWEAMNIPSSNNTDGYAKFLYKDIGVEPNWYKEWNKSYYKMDKALRKFSYKRRFCATRTGKMGWVPSTAREGDLVCLVSGAQVPIVLRSMPSAGEADRYMVVGDANFGGHMYVGPDKFYVGGERLAIV